MTFYSSIWWRYIEKSEVLKPVCMILIGLLCSQQIRAQECRIDRLNDDQIIIQSTDTISLRFLIADAVSSQLGVNGQGVCRVSLEFFHRDITDLNMTLYSPDGNNVILVGPAVEGSAGLQLFGLLHDISFIPSSATASPDGGMSDRWDNQDPDWGNNPAYAGSYYPNSGDLDVNFASGPVNGIWELVIIDQFPTVQNEGRFGSFRVEFCDQRVECNICEASAGTFDRDTITVCEGQSFNFRDHYTPDPFTTDEYEEVFLVFSGNLLRAVNKLPDFEGSYTAYAITLLKEQITSFNQAIMNLGRTEILSLIDRRGGQFCIDRSESSIFTVSQSSGIKAMLPADSLIINCSQTTVDLDGSNSISNMSAVFTWRDSSSAIIGNDPIITVDQAGRYTLQISDGLCTDSVSVVVTNEFDQLSVALKATVEQLSCKDTITALTYNTSMKVNSASWLTNSGNLISNSDSLIADAAGRYYIELVGDGQCRIFDSIEIFSDFEVPSARLLLDTLNCISPAATISILDAGPGLNYTWRGSDFAELSNEISLRSEEPGSFFLEVIGQNGCDTLIDFNITIDTIQPDIKDIPQESILNCLIDEISVNPSVEKTEKFTILWTQNGDIFSDELEVVLSDPGTYTLNVTGENGCTATKELFISEDRDFPDINLMDTTLTCEVESIIINSNIDTALFEIRWSGGSLSGVTSPNPEVNTGGVYIAEVKNRSNQCVTTDSIMVQVDRADPEFSISGDSILTCTDSVAVVAISHNMNSEVIWISSSGDSLSSDIFNAASAEEIAYIIRADNGCAVNGLWSITEDRNPVPINLDDTYYLTCDISDLTLAIRDERVEEVIWTSNILSSNSTEFIAQDTGFVGVRVKGVNGCISEKEIEIVYDKEAPQMSILTNDTITCTLTPFTLQSEVVEPIDEVTYIWTLDGQIQGSGPELRTDAKGIFSLVAFYESNGCSSEDSVRILLSDDPILGVDLQISPESCAGENDGSIILNELLGGRSPFLYTIDGTSVGDLILTDLKSGSYDVSIRDANSCILDTTIIVEEGRFINVDLGSDLQVDVGETIAILPNITGEVDDFGWFVNGITQNSGSTDGLYVQVNQDLLIIMKVFSEGGCLAEDSLFIDAIFSIDDVDIYIPNVFMPSGSSLNRRLTVTLNESVQAINKFSLFDRWGNKIHQLFSPPGRFNIVLWDGTIDGRAANPGVYTYLCELTTNIEGQTKIISGNVTLLD